MRQCRGRTQKGERCKKRSLEKSHYCSTHKNQKTSPTILPIAGGALVGHLIFPGVGGAIVGGLAGAVFNKTNKEGKMSKPKVFISFDYDHDETLKTFLVGQSKHTDSPFEIADWSIKEHIQGDWKAKARTKILKSDQVVVICGQHTHTATGVSAELLIAQEEKKPYFLLNGYKDKTCYKPKAAKSTDKLYKWTWENLKSLIGGAR